MLNDLSAGLLVTIIVALSGFTLATIIGKYITGEVSLMIPAIISIATAAGLIGKYAMISLSPLADTVNNADKKDKLIFCIGFLCLSSLFHSNAWARTRGIG